MLEFVPWPTDAHAVRRGNWADRPERLFEHSRNGTIRAQTLEALGVPSWTTYRRCQPGGPWTRLLPGVVCLHNGPVTRLQRVSAALLYGGPRAVLTGGEACRRHGLKSVPPDDSVHLLVPDYRKVHSSGFVHVERTYRMPAPVMRDGIPLTPLIRAALDASRQLTTLDSCRGLLSEVVQRGLVTHKELAAELAMGSSRGSAIPRRVLAELSSGAHSVAEIDAHRLWKRSGLPAAAWNGRLLGPDRSYVASPDAWCDEVGFGWEIDSVAHHTDPIGFARTLARNTRYSALGVIVVQTLPMRLRTEPRVVIAELCSAYAAAAARPRPPVIFIPR